jgi:glycosyltransferase involved in cell wall biosynthesis
LCSRRICENFLVPLLGANARQSPMRILYSFPYSLGAPGVGTTAHQQVLGLTNRGHAVTVFAASIHRDVGAVAAELNTTMMVGGIRVPHRVLGMDRTMALHDLRVAQHLRRNSSAYDVVHCWPGVALNTSRAAAAIGIPALREVPNTHTANAYEVVGQLCVELGIELPRGHSHRLNATRLKREEAEYKAASRLLVPSDHVLSTFLARGVPREKLLRHQYGYDPDEFKPGGDAPPAYPFNAIFLGAVEPRKALHLALKAWRDSRAYERARLSIYGHVVESYWPTLNEYLPMPGVEFFEFTNDPAEILREAHALILPSIEEGSALVTYEAQGSGAIPLVSDAAGAKCEHNVTGLIHKAGDTASLTSHISQLLDDPALVSRLRGAVLAHRHELTWAAAAERLAQCYQEALDAPA